MENKQVFESMYLLLKNGDFPAIAMLVLQKLAHHFRVVTCVDLQNAVQPQVLDPFRGAGHGSET